MQDNDGKSDVCGTTGQTNLTMSTPIRKRILTNAGSNPFNAKTAETLATLDIKVHIVPTTHEPPSSFRGRTQSPYGDFSQFGIGSEFLGINSQDGQ